MPPPPPPPAPRSGGSFASSQSGVYIQRRRRKQEDGSNHNIHNTVGNGKTNTAGNDERSLGFKRKLFRGDRKKAFVKSLIASVVLVLWVSLFRLQHVALSNSQINVETKAITPAKNTAQDDSVKKSEKTIYGSRSSSSNAYDSIFCRAGSSSVHAGQKLNKKTLPNSKQKPVFLWGIPSTTSQFETGRRELLRKTYLDFFQQIQSDEKYQKTNATTAKSNLAEDKNLICSLHEWTCNANARVDCQMIYVFFIGGHEESFHTNTTTLAETKGQPVAPPPILLDESITDFREMLLPQKQNNKGFNFSEPGTVYLDIRENQFDGKMTTWFKFASLVAKEYNSAATHNFPQIDYIFKVDSDLMLLTPHFFRWFYRVHEKQQKTTSGTLPSVERVYGGIEFPATNCVENFTFDHSCPLPLSGPSYMSGELNFVSVDLATYIASDDCPREKWTIPHEDVSLSNYVYSFTNNTEYHNREQEIRKIGNAKSGDDDHSIHIVSVDKSMILLLPTMKANWETVSIRKNPDLLRSGELLWAHSIKRGNHTQYLYWKKDTKFRNFWRMFLKIYTTTGEFGKGRKKKDAKIKGNSLSNFKSALRKRAAEKQSF